jgi:DNA-binding NtrC family response regulator
MVEANNLQRLLRDSEAGERVTLCFLEIDTMDLERQRLLPQLARKTGPFAELRPTIRFIFCLSEDLDTLYDRGLIDENLYLLTSSSELAVPGLDECRDDVPLLAQQILVREAAVRKLASVPRLDVGAKSFLRDQKWPGNFTELQQIVLGGLSHLRGNTVTRANLEKSGLPGAMPAIELRQHLIRLRDEYVQAAYLLSGEDRLLASEVLGVSPGVVDILVVPKSLPPMA